MAENKIKEVAKLLSVELEEKFRIGHLSTKYKLSKGGLKYWSGSPKKWNDSGLLEDLIIGTLTIIKISKPILDDIEKDYLSAVIKPFRDRVEWVRKFNSPNNKKLEYIKIRYNDCTYSNVLNFPDFKRGTMYRGMKIGKSYTLKELGL